MAKMKAFTMLSGVLASTYLNDLEYLKNMCGPVIRLQEGSINKIRWYKNDNTNNT